jgi:hypothetical protein
MPELINCDKDHTETFMDDGEIVICMRYHCASEDHKPNVYGQRIPIGRENDRNYAVPKCPWCGSTLVKGGIPDEEGLAIHGPA